MQSLLLPPNLDDIIPKNDPVRLILEVVELLNLSPIIKKYSNLGQNAYPPKILLALLFYAYWQQVYSSRKIAELVKFELHYMFIAAHLTPDFRTICRFRQDNLDLIEQYFGIIVLLCKKLGMITLQHISIDGSKIKASAGQGKMREKAKVSQDLAEVEAAIARILALAEATDRREEWECGTQRTANKLQLKDLQKVRQKLIAAKAELEQNLELEKVNLTDPQCRQQKKVGPGYNGQMAVDDHCQVILAADVVQDQNDTAQLLPMLAQAEANSQSEGEAKELSADSGYATGKAYQGLAAQPHIDAYVPPMGNDKQKNQPKPPYDKYGFAYDAENKKCVCPQGHPMKLVKTGDKNGVKYRDFKGTACENCPVKALCTKAKFRTVRLTEADHLVKAMEAKTGSAYGKHIKEKRSSTVEPVFGQIKGGQGFRSFSLRGLKKAKSEWKLVCMVHNIKKIGQFLGELSLGEALAAAERVFSRQNLFFPGSKSLIMTFLGLIQLKPQLCSR